MNLTYIDFAVSCQAFPSMINKIKKHLTDVNESYWQHFRTASTISIKLLQGGILCFIHAIMPSVFTQTASNIIVKLADKIKNRLNTP